MTGRSGTRSRWFRFKLATLFALITVLALTSYWLARPTIMAQQFTHAVAVGDYERAEQLFLKEVDNAAVFPGGFGTPWQIQHSTIVIKPLTWHQLLRGRREIQIDVPYGNDIGPEFWWQMDWRISIEANPRGLECLGAST